MTNTRKIIPVVASAVVVDAAWADRAVDQADRAVVDAADVDPVAAPVGRGALERKREGLGVRF